MNVAKQTFSSFLNANNLSTDQIVEFVVRNGLLKDFTVLQEAPFTDRGSIVDVFPDLSVWSGIKSVIDGININALY